MEIVHHALFVVLTLILLQETRGVPVDPEPCTINGEPDYCPVLDICCTTYCCPKDHVCFNESCLSVWVIIAPSVVGLGILLVIIACCIDKIKSKRWTSS